MLLVVLGAWTCEDVEKGFVLVAASETFARGFLLSFVEEGFGGEELVDDLHS